MNTFLTIWVVLGALCLIFALLEEKRQEKILIERQLTAMDKEDCDKIQAEKPVPVGDMEYAEWFGQRYGEIPTAFLEAYGDNKEFMQRMEAAISKNTHKGQWVADLLDDKESN